LAPPWSRTSTPTAPSRASRVARRYVLVEPHPVTRVLVAFALALIVVGLLAFRGLATVTGSWLLLAGSLLALIGLGNELLHRR
jgi:hypothetical protein